MPLRKIHIIQYVFHFIYWHTYYVNFDKRIDVDLKLTMNKIKMQLELLQIYTVFFLIFFN